MKLFLFAFAAVLSLASCSSNSSSNNDKKNEPALTELEAGFLAQAQGVWAGDCFQIQGGTAIELLEIKGRDSGTISYNGFRSTNCSGQPEALKEYTKDFAFKIDRFANGGGQININNEPVDISIRGKQMSVASAQGTKNYQKIK